MRNRAALAFWIWAVALAAPAHALVCGDGILDLLLGEVCDQGPANGTLGSCCTAGCQLEPATTVCRPAAGACDAAESCTGDGPDCPADLLGPDGDGDGVCDEADVCPVDFDPLQADGDDDGLGDACDVCTNHLPSFADRGRVTISRLDTPPGDDTLKIKGRCIPFLETPEIDPATNGVRILMHDKNGGLVFDVTIPPGAYSTVTRAGWDDHHFPAGVTSQYRNTGAVIPLVNGIRKVKLVLKNGLGLTKFGMRGKGGAYPLAPGAEPVRVTFVVSPPMAANGQCCEMLFTGPAPNPTCSFTGNGSTLRCK